MKTQINTEEYQNEIKQYAHEQQAEWLAWVESQLSAEDKLLNDDYGLLVKF